MGVVEHFNLMISTSSIVQSVVRFEGILSCDHHGWLLFQAGGDLTHWVKISQPHHPRHDLDSR